MKKIEVNVPDKDLIDAYVELKSVYKVGDKYGIKAHVVKRILKNLKVLRSQSTAAKERGHFPKYERTAEHKRRLSELAKTRIGEKNPMFGKKFPEKSKKILSEKARKRVGKLNSNYRHGSYVRRPRDFKLAEFKPVRNLVFNRDNYTCHYCNKVGGHLHAHHILPYWLKPEGFLDSENLITVCKDCHLKEAHKNNWATFDTELITNKLLEKYSLDRERLSELANQYSKDSMRQSDLPK